VSHRDSLPPVERSRGRSSWTFRYSAALREIQRGAERRKALERELHTHATWGVWPTNPVFDDDLIRFEQVDVDCADANGVTPLMAAAAMGNELLVRALLAAGANASLTCCPGAYSLMLLLGDDG